MWQWSVHADFGILENSQLLLCWKMKSKCDGKVHLRMQHIVKNQLNKYLETKKAIKNSIAFNLFPSLMSLIWCKVQHLYWNIVRSLSIRQLNILWVFQEKNLEYFLKCSMVCNPFQEDYQRSQWCLPFIRRAVFAKTTCVDKCRQSSVCYVGDGRCLCVTQ